MGSLELSINDDVANRSGDTASDTSLIRASWNPGEGVHYKAC